jgi:tRNA(Ile)-lysidine synthase
MITIIKDKFLEAIKEYRMLKPGDHVLIAVSGGPDSTALLFLLESIREEFELELHVAHLNHMLRKDAELDVKYVQGLAQRLRIPVSVESFDVQHYAKEEGMGLEEAARQIRYAFYERVANQIGAARIAVGHTADDNVETFLMRFLRGSGLKGLCGIPARRGRIIRPLIKIWRRQIEDYVGALKLVPRRDYTNYESRYMRNRVRLKLIPQLKIYNLNIREIILQTILLLTEDSNYLESKAEEALAETFISAEENGLKLDIEKIREWEYPIQGHLMRKAIEKVKGNLLELSFRHVQDILEKIESGDKWELHLPGGMCVIGNRNELLVSRKKPESAPRKAYRYSLSVPGEVQIKELGRKLKASVLEEADLSEDPRIAFVDYSALGRNLVVRSRQEGDRFTPLGMKGTKKIQDLFVDEKIPAENRDSIPIIESGGAIVWVGGMRIDERAKVTRNTKRVVKLELL